MMQKSDRSATKVLIVDDESKPRLARRISEFSAATGNSREGEAWRRHLQVEALQQALRTHLGYRAVIPITIAWLSGLGPPVGLAKCRNAGLRREG